jgi:hypothetical protein
MEVQCNLCKRFISRQTLSLHQRGDKCRADALAGALLQRGLVPYPSGNDLPDSITQEGFVTRAKYVGECLDQHGAVIPAGSNLRTQFWVPAWVRAVTGAWARAGRAHKNRRDRVLCRLNRLDGELHRAIVTQMSQNGDVGVLALIDRLAPDGAG